MWNVRNAWELWSNVLTNECDVLIALGMRFDDRVTGNLETYAKQAKVIHFEIDPLKWTKCKTEVAVLADVKESWHFASFYRK
jgi:acetolactate synthase-1/2/3 large subunit